MLEEQNIGVYIFIMQTSSSEQSMSMTPQSSENATPSIFLLCYPQYVTLILGANVAAWAPDFMSPFMPERGGESEKECGLSL